MMKITIFSILIASFSTLSFAQNPLSVDVLNLDTGLPASNISIVLEAQQGDKWTKLNEAKTNAEGRITDLYPQRYHSSERHL
jgi:5-hydroxyisourate hydrolase